MSKYVIIAQDEINESPREWDNLGTMACFHRRYTLGDKDHGLSLEEAQAIEADDKKYIALPLYLYDHSGITMNTTGFSCRWDSGQVGVIFVSKEAVRKEYGWKVITKARKEQILGYLKGEVETYDQFLRGDVYGFKCVENGEETDSCWGFYGTDPKENGMIDHIGKEFFESAKIIREYLGESIPEDEQAA